MAMYGLGARYETDVTDVFVQNELACVGWNYEDAPSLHEIMRSVQVGDIIYLKSHPPSIGLIIKAIGLVRNSEVFRSDHGAACVRVEWLWQGPAVTIGHVQDRSLQRQKQHSV